MNDGLFQLLFIGVLVLASILDASTRKRRRQQRMERREQAGGADADAGMRGMRTMEEDARGSRTTARGTGPGTLARSDTGGATRERADSGRTADSMVPADLWEILTGEKRAPTREEPEPQPEPEAPPVWSFDDRVEEAYEPPPTYQPSPEEERVEMPAAAPRPWAAELEIRRSAPPAAPPPAAMGAPLEPAPPLRHAPAARSARRPAASAYAELLRAGGPDSIRTAIVVSEVLGPPAGLRRREDGGWERP